jgi:hypothetical protein
VHVKWVDGIEGCIHELKEAPTKNQNKNTAGCQGHAHFRHMRQHHPSHGICYLLCFAERVKTSLEVHGCIVNRIFELADQLQGLVNLAILVSLCVSSKTHVTS